MDRQYPPDPDAKPLKVSVHKHDFVDESRGGRKVPVKFIYPVKHDLKNLPLIVWSHGLGGSRDGAGFIGRYLASHGYVVVNVQHKGTDSSLWEGKPGHPWDNIRASKISRKDTIQRFRDIPFLLDALDGWIRDYPELGKMVDLSRIGMSGHSFGAVTTQVMAGQKLGRGNRMYSLKEDRFKAAIAFSPTVTYNHREDSSKIYGPIDLPMLYMTGTKDESPVSNEGFEYRLDIFHHAGGPDQYLMVLEDGDHMVFAGSRGKLGESAKRGTHEDIIRAMALAFWDAYLKDDQKAKDWLTTRAQAYLSAEADFTWKNI